MDFRSDERGLAMGIVSFFAMLTIAALLFTLFNPAMTEVFSMTSSQAQTSAGQEQIDLAEQIWNAVLFFMLFLSLLFIVARSVFESKRSGGL